MIRGCFEAVCADGLSGWGKVVALYLCRAEDDPCGLSIEYLDMAALDNLIHDPVCRARCDAVAHVH